MPLPIVSYEEGETDGLDDTRDSTNRAPVIPTSRAETIIDRIMEERIVPDMLRLNFSLGPSRPEMGQGPSTSLSAHPSQCSLSTLIDIVNAQQRARTEFLRLRACYGTTLYLWMRREFIRGRGFENLHASSRILGRADETAANEVIASVCDFLLDKQNLQYERAPIILIPSLPSLVALLITPDFAADREHWEPIIQAHTGHTIAEIAEDSFNERAAPARPTIPNAGRRDEPYTGPPLPRGYASFLRLRRLGIISNTRYHPNYTPIFTVAGRSLVQNSLRPSSHTTGRSPRVASHLPTSPTPDDEDTSDEDGDYEYEVREYEGPSSPRPRRRSMSPQASSSKHTRHIYRY